MIAPTLDDVSDGLVSKGVPEDVAKAVVAEHAEAKRRYALDDLGPQAVSGDRFTEAVLRALQALAGLEVTGLTEKFKADAVLTALPNLEQGVAPDSVRLAIPRALRVIYDVRNKRNTAHLLGGIDPNLQDATLIVSVMDWVVAELVGLTHKLPHGEAQAFVDGLVTKEVPAIQVIAGQPVVLADISARDRALLTLYRAGAAGHTIDDLLEQLMERHRRPWPREFSS